MPTIIAYNNTTENEAEINSRISDFFSACPKSLRIILGQAFQKRNGKNKNKKYLVKNKGNLIMKLAFSLMLFNLFGNTVIATEVSAFPREQKRKIIDFQREKRLKIAEHQKKITSCLVQSRSDLREWRALQQKKFIAFKKAANDRWGEFKEPTERRWVEYGSDCTSVSTADFEKGIVTIEVLVPANESKERTAGRIGAAVKRTVTSRGASGLVPIETDSFMQQLGIPLFDGQVRDSCGRTVTGQNALEFTDALLEKAAVTKAGAKGVKKIRLSFELVPDHIKKRMNRYLPYVRKYCRKYNLDEAHVLATIHTESHFNPMARSGSSAIGLMQIVQDGGAGEAYRFITGEDGIPSERYLFDPEINIEMGCAYIYLLKNRYFGGVQDTASTLYCSIAGYNTGPGNVAYAFAGTRELGKAVKLINDIKNPEDVYMRMVGNLPSAETRRYLPMVRERMDLYRQ